MKVQLDLRSVLFGMIIAIIVTFSLGASRSSSTSTTHGRFQLCLPGEGSHAFVIDTTTGQVWSKSTTGREDFYRAKNNPKSANNVDNEK